MIKYGALFDLDGVLIDSETRYTEFWREIDRIYPTGIANYAIAIKGTTLPEIMKHYSDEAAKADILRRIHDFQETMTYSLYDGVVDFLCELRSRGIPAAINTSSDARKMELLFSQLAGFRDYFDAVIDASMIQRSKPDPQGYLIAAEALGCDPANCFVFEDSLQGLKAGRASGATVIGIATTYPAERLEGMADEIYGAVAEIDISHLLELKQCR